ncbi:hypothetical protein SAMN05519103_00430 [Rhizobiales bacterium GAS113]|nr:hypothetical protein SAMN05519103_00430 [Rhizobiales bacterium GAS113]
MKVTIDVDFTPLEARQILGLPDVQPMQKAALAKVEKRVMAEAERFSPEGLIKMWFSGGPQNVEWLRDKLGGIAQASTRAKRIDEPKSSSQE